MKIVALNFSKGWRGGERQTLLNCVGLKNRGVDIELWCIAETPLYRKSVERTLSVVPLRSRCAALMRLLISGHAADCIHAQTSHAFSFAVLTSFAHRRPIVYTRRVDFIPRGILSKLKYLRAAKIVAISGAIQSIVSRFLQTDIPVISSAVEARPLDRRRAEKFLDRYSVDGKKIVGAIGSLVPHKDPLTLIHAAASLASLRNDCVVFHFGDGPLYGAARAEIDKHGLEKKYILAGFINRVEDFFSVFDLFVMSSSEEGLGSSVLDAFIYRVPVVATTAGGLKELVEGRGLTCDIGDSGALAKNIDTMLTDTAGRTTLTARAYDYAQKNHSIERIAEHYCVLFKEVVKDSG
jgi:glycosyltransferase involved in cell wall biosynthesis